MTLDKIKRVAAAFSALIEQVRQGIPVNFSKLGLNSTDSTNLKKAVTHNYNLKEHGFNLQAILTETSKGMFKENECPRNPKDEKLHLLLAKAMIWHQHHPNAGKEIISLSKVRTKDLKAELARREAKREDEAFNKDCAKKLGCSLSQLRKIAKRILTTCK